MEIYIIKNKLNSKVYIGQTKNSIEERFKQHCWFTSKQHKSLISYAIRKYGKENFYVESLGKYTTQEELNEAEQNYIHTYNSVQPNGYNLQTGGSSYFEVSEETRKRLSKILKGIPKPESFRQNMIGKKLPEEHRQAIGKALKGKKFSKSHRENISKARTGKKHTEEYKQRMSKEKKGIPNFANRKPMSIEEGKLILSLLKQGVSLQKISDKTGFSIRVVRNIKEGKHWIIQEITKIE